VIIFVALRVIELDYSRGHVSDEENKVLAMAS
jgi:hypothetical protein